MVVNLNTKEKWGFQSGEYQGYSRCERDAV
jgi:hypothetical protein